MRRKERISLVRADKKREQDEKDRTNKIEECKKQRLDQISKFMNDKRLKE